MTLQLSYVLAPASSSTKFKKWLDFTAFSNIRVNFLQAACLPLYSSTRLCPPTRTADYLSGGISPTNGTQSFHEANYNCFDELSLFNQNQDTEKRGNLMTSRPVTIDKDSLAMSGSFEFDIEKPDESSTADKSEHDRKPQKIIAGILRPTCEHDWLKLADDLQTLASEGKTIWQCKTCAEITNTYNWQTP